VETILSQHRQRVYTVYMHPAWILAKINIIFPVFADRYVQRQLQRKTVSSAKTHGLSDILEYHSTTCNTRCRRYYGV